MILSYVEVGDGKRHKIKAKITTDHPNSSYGQPVILLDGEQQLDAFSWVAMDYQVVKATKTEMELLERWLDLISP